jgi:hypothetical protein
MKAKAKHEGPLKIDMKFDEAIKRALGVKPPPEGWAEYEKRLKAEKPKRKSKTKTAA